MSRSKNNRVVVELTTDKALTGKEAAAVVDMALTVGARSDLGFRLVKTLEFKRVIAKMDDHKKFNRTLKSVTKRLQKRAQGNGHRHP